MPDGVAQGDRPGSAALTVVTLDEVRSGARLLRPIGPLDVTMARSLRQVAGDLLAAVPPFVVVDLSKATAASRDGVQALVHIAEDAGKADIGLCVVITDGLRTALDDDHVCDLFELHETVEEALEAMR